MWVDPHVRDLILKCGAKAGDEIGITKREVKRGNRRTIEWEVAKVEEEPPHEQPAPLPPPQPKPATPAAAPAPQPINDDANQLVRALYIAIDAAALAEIYAREKGLSIRFTSEDIRTVANALMMRAERRAA